MDYKAQYQQYEQILSKLKGQCSTAEKESIVAETNLNNLRQKKEQLIEECEAFTGTTIDKVPELLTQKREELSAIMTALSGIDNTGTITQDKVDAVKAIMDEYSINPVE